MSKVAKTRLWKKSRRRKGVGGVRGGEEVAPLEGGRGSDIKPGGGRPDSAARRSIRRARESQARAPAAVPASSHLRLTDARRPLPWTVAHHRRAAHDLTNMFMQTVLLLSAGLLVSAAKPDPPEIITTVGSQKLATASDCSKPVAFSGSHASIQDARLILTETLLDQGVGYAASTGIFTTFCPGLYQFSFAGYGSSDLRLSLKRKLSKTDSWKPIVSSGPAGGANLVLLRMAVGDQVALFVESGKVDESTTFSGYRIAKE